MISLPRSGRARRTVRLIQHMLFVAGLLALGYCLAVYLNAKFYQAGEARKFNRERQLEKAGSSRPSRPALPPAVPEDGSLLGRLEIPRIGVSVMVVEGVDEGDLKQAAGHIPGTALPGQPGNVGIAAHRDTFFRALRSIRRDDAISLSTLQGTYRYQVVSTKVVSPDDIQVLYPTGRDRLTLVTCFPFYYVGSAPERFIVEAERVPGGTNSIAQSGR
jgi:sortase A